MGVIKIEDIMACLVGQACVCWDCATIQEISAVTREEIITLDEVERGDALYFCDRCNEHIG